MIHIIKKVSFITANWNLFLNLFSVINLGSITVGQLLRAHREQSDRIDVLLSENEKLTNALAESRRQNEVGIV